MKVTTYIKGDDQGVDMFDFIEGGNIADEWPNVISSE